METFTYPPSKSRTLSDEYLSLISVCFQVDFVACFITINMSDSGGLQGLDFKVVRHKKPKLGIAFFFFFLSHNTFSSKHNQITKMFDSYMDYKI